MNNLPIIIQLHPYYTLIMAKSNRSSTAAEPPASTSYDMLDPAEVMKAMLAQKGKGKQVEDSGSESGSETSASEDGDQSQDGSEIEGAGDDDIKAQEDEGSEAESSRSAELRLQKRSRSTSQEVLQPISRMAPVVASRVKPEPKTDSQVPRTIVSETSKPSPVTTFETLGMSKPLISALASIHIKTPTEIQAACIGPIMSGRDCIGGAKTGSGKTLAFALPIVERIARDPFGVWAVVLTPTRYVHQLLLPFLSKTSPDSLRELAYQLTEQFMAVGKPLGLTTVTIVGGMDMMLQAQQLEARPHIIVATPGRLCDLLRSGGSSGGDGKLGRVRTLVLDEADRLLTPSFAPELAYLFSQMPPKRQTCLFTATVSDAIMDLANKPPQAGKQKPFVHRVESE